MGTRAPRKAPRFLKIRQQEPIGADVDDIAKRCADLAVAGFIEPTTPH